MIGGVHAAPGRVMGHAGAFCLPRESDALTKTKHLEDVGVTVVNHPAKLGDAMKTLLSDSGRASSGAATSEVSQRRGMHTMRRIRTRPVARSIQMEQRRTLYIAEDQAFDILRECGINASEYSGKGRERVSSSLPKVNLSRAC